MSGKVAEWTGFVARPKAAVVVAAVLGLVFACAMLTANARGAEDQSQVFRSTATVVPLDVRVVDRAGRPIAGLTKDDFTVVDNGVPQDIAHFWEHTLTDAEPQAAILLPGPRTDKLAPPSHRVFLIDLDRPSPDSAHLAMFDDVRTFLQQRLLRQDYAAIAAFGRVTDFTTDHAALAEVVTRLEKLTRTLGPGNLPLVRDLWASHPPVGSKADTLLESIFAPASTGQQLALRSRAGFEQLVDSTEQTIRSTARLSESKSNPQDTVEIAARDGVAQMIKVIGDIQMLRQLDGEKHLIYAAAAGIGPQESAALADAASDARVAVYGIQAHDFRYGAVAGSDYLLQRMAATTGGRSFPTSWPKDALANIDAITRTGYLLGYVPNSASDADGKPHTVVVRVKGRPDVEVSARRRYFAGVVAADANMDSMLMKQRVMSTAEYPRAATDIRVKATALAKDKIIAINVSIDANQLAFEEDAGRHHGRMEVATFSTDKGGRLIGEDWRTLTLSLEPDTLSMARADGLTQKIDLKVTGTAQFVKVVVYDYATKRAGSAIVKLR